MNAVQNMKKIALALPVAAISALPAVAQTNSTAPDLSSLTAAVDYSTVSPAILTTGALGIGMLLAWVAVKYVRRVVRSA